MLGQIACKIVGISRQTNAESSSRAEATVPGLTTDDELAIRNLVARYADAVCRRDATSWTATWAPDSTWEVGSVTTHGPAEARAFWQSALAKYPWLVQVVASGEVFEGETGPRGVWYVV